jgi:hypothetical protein
MYLRYYFGFWAETHIAQRNCANYISYCFYTSLTENIGWKRKKTVVLKLLGSASLLFYQISL